MLEQSFGLTFFLKSSKKKSNDRFIYLRVTVDGLPKETSTKRKWDATRWNQKTERATGTREDAKATNFFLETLVTKINNYRTLMMAEGQTITAQRLIDFVLGKTVSKAKVIEEFKLHNSEIFALVPREYSKVTYIRYETAKAHVQEFLKFKYRIDDLEFRELNYEFIKDFEFYLKTVKNISNNTTLKYISNFKKIVLRAIDKEIIAVDPFKRFKGKKEKIIKRPLTRQELSLLETHPMPVERLAVVRDVFVFQCYTGLAYIDVYNLMNSDIKMGDDDELWIISERQKTGSSFNVPLLPQALRIIERYKDHPQCLMRNTVLPVISNQRMNGYLKEIADLCGIESTLNTHKARRTFGSTVTLNNNVPIHVVKEMLGHSSVKQTEEYALTEQQAIGKEMRVLRDKFKGKEPLPIEVSFEIISRLENEIMELKKRLV
ncbi:site-specific integrase [Flavobacterium sp.]|uniref:site-specific integrase n=1 Tax=Flavobacterium sp. TaxID=239 RepID=UPI004034EEFC